MVDPESRTAGGSGSALEQLLASNITWTVPGDNRIAGTYRGLEEGSTTSGYDETSPTRRFR
jgi:ketosteroid isomerase-like protein